MTIEKAEEEAAADFAMCLDNKKIIRDVTKKDRSLARRIIDTIKSVLKKIKGAGSGQKGKTNNMDTAVYDRALEMWEAAYKAAAANVASGVRV